MTKSPPRASVLASVAGLLLVSCGPGPAPMSVSQTPQVTNAAEQEIQTTDVLTERVTVAPTPEAPPTHSRAPTDTPHPTDSAVRTHTPVPTPTHTATPASTPTPEEARLLVTYRTVNIRGGPGVNYAVVGGAKQGDQLYPVGYTHDDQGNIWFAFDWNGNGEYDEDYWIHGGLVETNVEDMMDRLPQLPAPPTPTPRPAAPTRAPLPDFVAPNARGRYSFDEIVSLLSSPNLVSLFMRNNIAWDGAWDDKTAGANEYAPARIVYQRGVDDCDGHATLQAYILKSHSYEAYNVGISIIGPNPLGHNVAGFRDKDDPSEIWSLNNGGEMVGPFSSWEELAQWYIDHGYAYADGTIRLFDPFGITEIATDNTHPSVLELPQIVVRE